VGDYTRFFLGYRLESLRLLNVENEWVKQNLNFENGEISSVTATLQHDKRNNRMETTSGHYAAVSEEFAGLGGNRKFLRTVGDARYYRKIWGELTFRTKLAGGTMWDYTGNGVQTSERFRLGGPNDLRGYNSFSVGPRRVFNGVPVAYGGLHQLFYMAELEYPIAREIGLKLVTFFDAGDAFNKFDEIGLKKDVGWGIRWFSPLGPLRFEWGYPLDGGESQFYFMIGPPF
jgi:outer membrane protein insertion porin family